MPTPIWLDYLAKLWPVVVVLASIFAALVGVWLSSRFAPRSEFEKVKNTTFEHGAAIVAIEETLKASPTRMELSEDISALAERMKGVETSVNGLASQQATTNVYLHTLIERGLK